MVMVSAWKLKDSRLDSQLDHFDATIISLNKNLYSHCSKLGKQMSTVHALHIG